MANHRLILDRNDRAQVFQQLIKLLFKYRLLTMLLLRKNLFSKPKIGKKKSSLIRIWLIRGGGVFIAVATLICTATASYYAGVQTRMSQEQNILAESARSEE